MATRMIGVQREGRYSRELAADSFKLSGKSPCEAWA